MPHNFGREVITGLGPLIGWSQAVANRITALAQGRAELHEFIVASVDAVRSAVHGRDPFSGAPHRQAGARAVANISAAHIPDFVALSLKGDAKPYRNGYDLGKYHVGDRPPGAPSKTREIVDAALPVASVSPADLYFCATELNGAGVRFYGDICLVLDRAEITAHTVVLDRNSFELARAPISNRISRQPGSEAKCRREEAEAIAGSWQADLPEMAALKVLEQHTPRARTLTTGQISDTLREDEDYIEVLRVGSFSAFHLQEARTDAADVAHESLIADRLRNGPAPEYAALLWRQRRRAAEAALGRTGLRLRVVTTGGRTGR